MPTGPVATSACGRRSPLQRGQLRAGTWLWVTPSHRVSPSLPCSSLALRACVLLSGWRESGPWPGALDVTEARGSTRDVAEPPSHHRTGWASTVHPHGRAAPAPCTALRAGCAPCPFCPRRTHPCCQAGWQEPWISGELCPSQAVPGARQGTQAGCRRAVGVCPGVHTVSRVCVRRTQRGVCTCTHV